MNIFVAILSLSFLIIVHEFGHFIVAKLSGIRVLEFSLFMGPKLYGIQKGDTLYTLRLIPLGGYVKMEGEEEASNDERAYNKKPIPVRAGVIAAGPFMNIVAAVIILTVLFSQLGFTTNEITNVSNNSPAYSADIRPGDKLVEYMGKKISHPMDLEILSYGQNQQSVEIKVKREDEILTKTLIPQRERYLLGFMPASDTGKDSNVVADVTPDSPAQKAEVKKGDRIIRLNGVAVSSRQDIGSYLNENKDQPVTITILRNNNEINLEPVKPVSEKNPEYYAIGIGGFKSMKGNIIKTINAALVYTWSNAKSVYYSIVWLVSGKVSLNQLMGPVGIVSTIGDVVQSSPTLMQKISGLLSFTAFISINLGIMNLVPFPALDGSKLILLAIEGIRKKAIPPEKEAVISMVGLAILIVLMIFATSNDVIRLFSKGG